MSQKRDEFGTDLAFARQAPSATDMAARSYGFDLSDGFFDGLDDDRVVVHKNEQGRFEKIEFYGCAELLSTGLALNDNISEDEWVELGQFLLMLETAAQWYVGDWFIAGRKRWGAGIEDYVSERSGFSPATVLTYVWVAEKYDPMWRRSDVSFYHHQKVATIQDYKERDRLLAQAAVNKWTAAELAAECKKSLSSGDEKNIAPSRIADLQFSERAKDVRGLKKKFAEAMRKGKQNPEKITEVVESLDELQAWIGNVRRSLDEALEGA